MKNIIFIDIDGTLVTQDGRVPASAKKAIKQSRVNGNLVYLCTGRSLPEITEDIQAIGFDGIIGAGGAYIEIDGQVIHHQLLDKNDVLEATHYFNKRKIGYYLESNDGIFANKYCVANIKMAAHKLMDIQPELFNSKDPEPLWFYEIIEQNKKNKINYNYINKISFIAINHPFKEVEQRFNNQFEIHHGTVFEFGPNSGELGVKNQNKYTAVKKVIDQLDTEIHKSYAFGDGLNDLDLFEAVDFSVAMANAEKDLKKIAHKVTRTAEENGIYNSFKKLKLL